MSGQPIRYAMVGGGEGAFIGAIHRTAASIAGNWRLVAGAFSADPVKARRSGVSIGVAPERAYGSYREMFDRERALPDDVRIEAVSIVTPNHQHAPIAIAAMEAGFDVICDKPIAETLENARAIERSAAKSGRRLAITHTYAGYPLVQQARALVSTGGLGPVRRVIVKYTQDWLARIEDVAGNKQAEWRTDPKRSGEGGAFGDIGTHAAHLVEYVTGERIVALCAELGALPGRSLDDDGAALLRLSGGGKGTLVASQVCVGDTNDLALAVYCENASLHWRQEQPNSLRIARRDRPEEIWHAGANRPYLDSAVRSIQRTPGGHPEGYLEAFANIYAAFGAELRGEAGSDGHPGYATIDEALRSMVFVRACRQSSDGGSRWIDLTAI